MIAILPLRGQPSESSASYSGSGLMVAIAKCVAYVPDAARGPDTISGGAKPAFCLDVTAARTRLRRSPRCGCCRAHHRRSRPRPRRAAPPSSPRAPGSRRARAACHPRSARPQQRPRGAARRFRARRAASPRGHHREQDRDESRRAHDSRIHDRAPSATAGASRDPIAPTPLPRTRDGPRANRLHARRVACGKRCSATIRPSSVDGWVFTVTAYCAPLATGRKATTMLLASSIS